MGLKYDAGSTSGMNTGAGPKTVTEGTKVEARMASELRTKPGESLSAFSRPLADPNKRAVSCLGLAF